MVSRLQSSRYIVKVKFCTSVKPLFTWLFCLFIFSFLWSHSFFIPSYFQMSQTVTLQASKTVIPRIGYGAGTKWYTGDNAAPIDKQLVQSIHEALNLGYRHLDAAEMYGTDTSIGEALRTQSIPRKDIFITSKVYRSIPNIEQACLDSLWRLGLDYLDLWLIHAPFFDRNKISLADAWKQMEKLVDDGKVKAIGVSNFQKQHLEELLAVNPKIKPAVNQSRCARPFHLRFLRERLNI